MNPEYYFENSFAVCLIGSAIIPLQEQLRTDSCKCVVCNSDLIIFTQMEGTGIYCTKKPWNHVCGYRINTDDFKHEFKPFIERYSHEQA